MRNKKSNGLLVASRLIGYIGVFACMLGMIIYLLTVVNNPDGAPLDMASLLIIAALAVAFVFASLALRIASNHAALETADDLDVVEIAMDGDLDEEDAEDAEDEMVGEAIEETADEDAAQNTKWQLTPEKKEKIVKVVKKNAPVILAVVATAAVSAALHNSAKNRARAKVRRNFLDLFY